MKAVVKLVVYLGAAVLLGALLAPLLFWAARALEPWALANGWLRWQPIGDQVVARGPLAFLETDFRKYFHRAELLAALLLLGPAIRWMGVQRPLRLWRKDARAWPHLGFGLLVGGGVVAAMAGAYVLLGFYHFKDAPPWESLGKVALSAAVVGVLEEALFRGALFGLFAQTLKARGALFWTTLIFALLHFIKPDDEVVVTQVRWSSGLELLPSVFHQFAEPRELLAGLTTMLVLGWLLGYARLRTEALWMGIGLHAGVVFVKMGFAKLTKRDAEAWPWVGPELQIGLVPVVLLLLALLLVWWRLEAEELWPAPPPRE